MRWPLAVWLGLLALLAIGYFVFPGHTFLQSDTQIYIPILERLRDPQLFAEEILAQQPHVSFTIYDETALWLRALTGLEFEWVLTVQQLLFRLCGLWGVFLIAVSVGLEWPGALLVAAFYGLGATINGPAVLTIEYEPVPRSNAIGLMLLATGLVGQKRYVWAGAAATLAFLYHAPAIYPFWGAYVVVAAAAGLWWVSRERDMARGIVPLLCGMAALVVLAQLQVGEGERQKFFETLEPAQAAMMRERAAYNWVSLWTAHQPQQYLLYFLVLLVALWRLQPRVDRPLRWLVTLAGGIGLLSMPLSFVLLEGMQWSLMPQVQPMRALLYITVFLMVWSATAGVAAMEKGRWRETGLWFFAAVLPAVQTRTVFVLWEPAYRQALGAAILVAAAASGAVWLWLRWKNPAPVLAAALLLAPMTMVLSGVRNYPALHHPELDEVAAWARTSTAADAVFFFPGAGKTLHPGVFRARSLRALYVDWKGGGQINFLREFLPLWLPRWKEVGEPEWNPGRIEDYRARGIDYVVLPAARTYTGDLAAAFRNGKYAVYEVVQGNPGSSQ
jgi:hypothetical protein